MSFFFNLLETTIHVEMSIILNLFIIYNVLKHYNNFCDFFVSEMKYIFLVKWNILMDKWIFLFNIW